MAMDGESTMEALEREKEEEEAAALREAWEERESRMAFLEREVMGLKQANAESEMKVRSLERKVGVWEVRESEERSRRVRVEDEVREKVAEIQALKQRILDLETAKVRDDAQDEQNNALGLGLGLGFVWPVVAAGCGTVVAVFYFCFRKRR
ncbi:peroxisomal and mitochondrial division factor 1-like isoform X2 [Cajanus cajan]|nr:peroxisomal and mitochondrial division factor 1-like isoform X2 [Cajanus cajan]